METADLRKELHQCIEESDDRLIKMMYAMIKEYNENDEYDFTKEEIKQFDEIREKRLRGESKLYTWEEAKEIIMKKQSPESSTKNTEDVRRKLIMKEREQYLKGEGKSYPWEEVKDSILSKNRL